MPALAAVAPPQNDLEPLGHEDFVTVFLGKEQFGPKDFRDHPQVQYLTADNAMHFARVRDQISERSKVYITTEGIPYKLFQEIIELAKDRHLPYVHRKHPNGVAVVLAKYFPEGREAITHALDNAGDPVPEKGRIQALLDRADVDLSKSSTEEARRIFAIAQKDGIVTTLNSLAQAIGVRKRKAGSGDIPASARKRNPTLEILTELEDMQIRLGLMKEYIETTTAENTRLRAQLADVHRVLGVVAP